MQNFVKPVFKSAIFAPIFLCLISCGGEDSGSSSSASPPASTPEPTQEAIEQLATESIEQLSVSESFTFETTRSVKLSLSFPEIQHSIPISIYLEKPINATSNSQLIEAGEIIKGNQFRTRVVIPTSIESLWVTVNENYNETVELELNESNRVTYAF